MAIYRISEINKTHPKVIESARKSSCGNFIELADNFKFDGQRPNEAVLKGETVTFLVRGMGDIVAGILKPAVHAVDRIAGTNIENCGGCKKRQATLNRLFPS